MTAVRSISLPVALRLNSESFSGLEDFFARASKGEYMMFTHRNYYYSTPKWGEKWQGGKDFQFHKVDVKCSVCGYMPERNVSAVGTMFLVKDEKPDRAMIVCPDHVVGHTEYVRNKEKRIIQLTLF